ncbi:class I SAM-dependent methyltransferase [Selenomonas sp. FC4001]|uniref:class I SAM-dependent methyltransferase n=1 Tax=Selenomonas sp. FC4001 TaxID=1408313 RepID=UPI00055B9B57|nr:class I SAM-dependent methyltransferase [Selenomonas sp. FC4001]
MYNISLDELPKYTPWVNRLLFEDIHYSKNPYEISREYNEEKWHDVKKYLMENSQSTLEEIISLGGGDTAGYIASQGGFCVGSMIEFYEKQIEKYVDFIGKYWVEDSPLIELGAGYGSMLLKLAKHFNPCGVYGLEYTDNGVWALSEFAKRCNIDIHMGKCDFFELSKEIQLPANGVIFTSYSLMYVPELSSGFLDYILEMKPRVCINIEPCYEYYSTSSLHGALCKKYVEVNDYNRNLVEILNSGEKDGRIEILEVEKNSFGENALSPASFIAWKSNID